MLLLDDGQTTQILVRRHTPYRGAPTRVQVDQVELEGAVQVATASTSMERSRCPAGVVQALGQPPQARQKSQRVNLWKLAASVARFSGGVR